LSSKNERVSIESCWLFGYIWEGAHVFQQKDIDITLGIFVLKIDKICYKTAGNYREQN
jgi:hypothetical protein